MDLLEVMRGLELEQVVAVNDPATGLLGFIVIHDTTRGPGVGGCRLTRYASAAEALADGAALARAMTRKCALAGLNAGGAKGVFIDHAGVTDRPAMLRALGQYIESLGGRFYTSGDLGIGPEDIVHIRETTRYVAVPHGEHLDLSGAVATGVLAGMRAALDAAGLGGTLNGRRVAVQGLGAMGGRVAELLVRAGAKVVAAELDGKRAAEARSRLGIEVVEPDAIYDLEVDVFSPSAVGGVLNQQTIPRLRAPVVCGVANNQLGDPDADTMLQRRGIRYAPDFAVNAGAMILAVRHHLEHLTDGRGTIERAAERIGETVKRIFEESDATGEPPGEVAGRLAEEALVRPKSTRNQWWPVH